MNWFVITVYVGAVIVFIGWLFYQLRRAGRHSIGRHENAGTRPVPKPTASVPNAAFGADSTVMERHDATPRSDGRAPVTDAAPGLDDLTRIKGIGKVIATQLNDLGVTSLAQIAALTPEDVKRIDEALSFKGRIERDDWVGQAKRHVEEEK